MRFLNSFVYLCLAGFMLPHCAEAQGIISTVAGGPAPSENIKATLARLDGLRSLAVDLQGNAYIADGPRIRRVDAATGIIATVAGNGQQTPFTDGVATQVALGGANYLKFDSRGKLLFVDSGRIMKFDPQTGLVATIAGQATSPTEPFNNISGFAPDPAGNFFLSNDYTGKLYRVDGQSGAVAIFAGTGGNYTGTPGGEGGPASQAALLRPGILTIDASGNIFFAEQYWLRRIDGKTGIITTLVLFTVSGGYGSGTGDGGPYSKALLGSAGALTTDSAGNLYIGDGPRVRKITFSTGIIQTVAGSGQSQYASDGVPALQANLNFLYAIVIDASGNLWLADQGNSRVFEISASSGLIRTVAGRSPNGDGGLALGASLPNASGIAVSPAGDLYIDTTAIRRVDHATGIISTFVQAQELYGRQFTFDNAGNIYFATTVAIERIDAASGKITTVAGLYYQGFSGDGGPATSAAMSPSAVAVDSSGNLYIADYFNYRIRRVDAKTGIINTVAGNGSSQSYNGQPGQPTQVAIGVPTSIAVQPDGNVYWTNETQVLKLDPSGNLSPAAGNGGCSYAGDGGSATLASLCHPMGIAFDPDGNMFVGDANCSCVRRVAADTGIIQTVAGTGQTGVSPDGVPATQAALNYAGLAFASGTLYIIDEPRDNGTNPSIRAVSPPVPPALPQPPKITQVADAVNFGTAFSPGALISILGNYLSSPNPASGQIGPDGRFTKTLAGTQVTVQGIAAPLLYTSPAQINAVIPYAATLGIAPVQITTATGADTYSNAGLSQTSLSLFPGLVFNPDGSLNSKTNPAPKGATLVMYGTGMGQTNPPGVDGAIVQGPNFPQPVNKFVAVLQGPPSLTADIPYLGPLPGSIAGAVQANIHIPDTTPPGASTLLIGSPYPGSVSQTIYMLSDPPVITSISPASPIPQTVGQGLTLSLTGQNLVRITGLNFYFNGVLLDADQQFFSGCPSPTSCAAFFYPSGQAGDYAVEAVNAINQVSNRVPFSVGPYGSPTVAQILLTNTSNSPVTAKNGIQQVTLVGSNFLSPLTVDIFYNNARIATLNSADLNQIVGNRGDALYLNFDFQGNAGAYGVEVAGTNGRSPRFNFNVAAP